MTCGGSITWCTERVFSLFLPQLSPYPRHYLHQNKYNSHNTAHTRNVVAILGVESNLVVGIYCCCYAATLPPAERLNYIATLIDDAAYARICASCYATACLYGTQTRETAMLAIAGSVAPPAIVGDDENHLCTILNKTTAMLAKCRLVTYWHAALYSAACRP